MTTPRAGLFLVVAALTLCGPFAASEVRGATANISYPGNGTKLSNVTATLPGSTVVNVTGSVSGADHWILDYCCPPPNNADTEISHGSTTSVTGAWETLWVLYNALFPAFVPNGPYPLRLRAFDGANPPNEVARATVTPVIANFTVRQGGKHYGLQLDWTVPDTVTYTSILPDLGTLTPSETLFINDSVGNTIRTFAANTGKGTYTNDWKGRTDSDGLLPDGKYFYFARVTAGSNTMTWDVGGRFLYTNDTFRENSVTASDAFNNVPFKYTYNLYGSGSDLDLPSQVWMIFAQNTPAADDCGSGQYCLFGGVFQPGGSRTVEWAYVDGNGTYRGAPTGPLPALRHFILYARVTNFPLNMVILYGGAPKVMGVKVTPALFKFGASSQAVDFDLAMPSNDSTTLLTVSFQNQASGSILRTLTLPNRGPGHITTTWDGRATNGTPVAPGFYTVTVTAKGPRNEVATGQILTTVQY